MGGGSVACSMGSAREGKRDVAESVVSAIGLLDTGRRSFEARGRTVSWGLSKVGLKEAKDKLEKRVEELTWRLQLEKQLKTNLEEEKAQHIAKLQDALHAMQLQVEEANSKVIKEREAVRKAIEEAPPVIKETPVLVQDTEKLEALTAEVESFKHMIYGCATFKTLCILRRRRRVRRQITRSCSRTRVLLLIAMRTMMLRVLVLVPGRTT
ncbi:hypothetical protein LWI29_031338 [Acer saccharum]|uniref:Uncharacterized protein n=1 Tax=Acer saccharum TaxID=4024 RepID=A0AA39W448_ACESA|nr:hypothetical protein LWI29_031338 [Acer saccharum]